MSKFKEIISEVPQRAIAFVSSPKFAAALGVGVAVFQLAAAWDQYKNTSSRKKQIGFGKQDKSNLLSKFLGNDD